MTAIPGACVRRQLPARTSCRRSIAPRTRPLRNPRLSAPSASCRPSTISLFLGASVSRYPLEGYREKCATDVTLGTRFAKKPIELKIPITIAGMSFGALGANAKEASAAPPQPWAPPPRPATAA